MANGLAEEQYDPIYSDKVIDEFKENHPSIDFSGMSPQQIDALISMSTEGTPPYKLTSPDTGQDVAKGGLIKKKKKKMRHGGVHTKRPQMVHGGAYKGKKHSYAAGGAVKDTKMMRTK